ncbi:MAG TPA: hypothetical protein VFX16_16945 [Pseudonocardiaceae bacterium]|nr:hypothetical protein [Pseudonocardiaceae bacterium]
MKYGHLSRSLASSLSTGEIEPTHRPDGLTEEDIDALAAEAGIDLNASTDVDNEPAGIVIPLWPAGQNSATPMGDEAA